jgi:uroporphyrinogen-III synthase
VGARDAHTLLITRSEPGASGLAAALTAQGYACLVRPMVAIAPRVSAEHDALARALDRFHIVICLSAAAAEHALPRLMVHWPRPPDGQQWLAVGAATAAAVAAYGYHADAPAEASSEGLLTLPALADVQGRAVLILCGVGGRAVLVDALRARGADVTRFECYERVTAPGTLDERDVRRIGAIVVSSGDGGERLAAAWRKAGGAATVPVVVPSRRVAALMREHGFRQLVVGDGASAAAVAAALTRIGLGGSESAAPDGVR